MVKTCTMPGCSKKHFGKGYCQNHYRAQKYYVIAKEGEPSCSIDGCNIVRYAKGLCRKHYANKIYSGNPISLYERRLIGKFCSVQGCNEPAKKITRKPKKAYCKFHYIRKLKKTAGYIKSPLKRPKGIKGELNPRWNGGVSEYPNHYEFKKARLRVLEKANYKCIKCGERANNVHHKDRSKHNHADENLEPLCHKCHHKYYHRGTKHASKYTKLYGAHLYELSKQLRCSAQTIINLHTKGILHERLESAQLITV